MQYLLRVLAGVAVHKRRQPFLTVKLNTGIGSPLFSNDEVVIDKMIEFGYDKEDANKYCTDNKIKIAKKLQDFEYKINEDTGLLKVAEK